MYNFTYGQRGQEENNIIERISQNIFNDTELVEMLLSKDIFSIGDAQNYFTYNEETGEEAEFPEIYQWARVFLPEYQVQKLIDAKYVVLDNDFGTWVGVEEFGTSWDVYFYAGLANAIYNQPENE
jgi:hypothetical protein